MCVFLYMHPSPDFLPQPASQQDSHQCHVDDNSAGEDNGGPGKSHWHGVITARQQFYTDRVNADFCHEDDSLGKYRASWMAHTDGEEERHMDRQHGQRLRRADYGCARPGIHADAEGRGK